MVLVTISIEIRFSRSEPPAASKEPLQVLDTTAEEIPPTRPSTRLAKARASNVVALPVPRVA
jgi:hypothetical protein